MLFSPVFAKLQQRPGHQPALTRPDLLSVRLIQGISFQSITHSFARRPTAIPFPFNHFHTLFIVTEGVPSCLSDFAQFWGNLSPFRFNTYEKQAGWGSTALPNPQFHSFASRNELVYFHVLADSFLGRL